VPPPRGGSPARRAPRRAEGARHAHRGRGGAAREGERGVAVAPRPAPPRSTGILAGPESGGTRAVAPREDPARFLAAAVDLATRNARRRGGGPFGALVVRRGEIVGRGVNRVTPTNDPTAHAEIVAIRRAC